jgi:hypothetical protein
VKEDMMSEKISSDFGTVYFSNMTEQSMQLTLNQSVNKVLELSAMGGPPAHVVEPVSVLRVYDPEPYQKAVFGSKNTIEYRLGCGGQMRSVSVEVDCDDYHINRDIQIYVFYESLVLRMEGVGKEHKATFSM